MKHNVQADGIVKFVIILLKLSALNPAHGRSRTAESGIAGHRIVVVKLSPAYTACHPPGKIIIQEPLMRDLLHSPFLKRSIIQPPANVIVTSQIVQECIFLRKCIHNIHLSPEQTDICCRHSIPDRRHCRHIVQHMALRLLHRSKIGSHLLRLHHYLAKKQNAGAHDLADHPHHPHDRMDLWKISALCSQLFPDIGDRVDPYDIHSLICQEKKIVHHLVEHARISVIQIPLIRIKCRHHIMPCIWKPCKIPRRRSREHLRHCLFVFLRDRVIAVEEIPAHTFPFSAPCPHCPFMILRCMVHDKIHTQIHPLLVTGICQCGQIIHRSELRLYFPKVCHCIPAVRTPLRGVQKRHQMDTVHAAGFQIWKLFLHPF